LSWPVSGHPVFLFEVSHVSEHLPFDSCRLLAFRPRRSQPRKPTVGLAPVPAGADAGPVFAALLSHVPDGRVDMHDFAQPGARLRDVLLAYLHVEGAFPWPGTDGLTLDEVLAAYIDAARHGRVPGLAQLCRRHPELADEAIALFAAVSRAERPPERK
jgi:hypothetical protein